ncbi:MAG TPA: MBOAT family protein [Candidatus Saccharimonadia bacterium]|nr:MBOAT family protein [Candidatus Saccharimonadia bacterium]
MTPATGFAIWLAEALLIAAWSAHRDGARIALAIAVLLLPYPFLIDAAPWVRMMFAIGALWCCVRAADFVFEPAPARFGARFVHLFAILDTRLVARGSVPVPGRWFLFAALAFVLACAALLAIHAGDSHEPAARYAIRWFAGIVLIVAMFEMLTALARIVTALAGLDAPALSDTPHRARSIAEFWSSRWNLVVGKVLRDRIFTPLAHRGPVFAIWATFAVSAAFHAYLIGVALEAPAALASAAFFLVQPVLLGAERKLRIRHMPEPARRAWTIGILALFSPLFIEPVLRVFDSVF